MPWATSSAWRERASSKAKPSALLNAANNLGGLRPADAQHPHLGGVVGGFHAGVAPHTQPSTYLSLHRVGPRPHRFGQTVIGYPVAFIGIALGAVALIWVITAMASPRLVGAARRCRPSVPQNRMPCMRDTQCGDHGCSSASIQLLRLRSSHQTRRLIKGSNLSGWPPSEPLLGSLPGRNTQQIHHGRQRQRRPADFAPVCQQGHLSGCPKGQLA